MGSLPLYKVVGHHTINHVVLVFEVSTSKKIKRARTFVSRNVTERIFLKPVDNMGIGVVVGLVVVQFGR